MQASQLAVQLYTLRDLCKTAPDLAAAAKKVRAIGYTAVQVSGVGPIPEREIVAILHGEGLTICATHEPATDILRDPAKVIARLKALDCTMTAFPFPRDIDLAHPVQIHGLARDLDASGAALRAAGLTLGYHNHGIEFVKFEGAPVLEYIYAHTDPQNLLAELDTYWIHYGGGDVVDWCERMNGRLPFIHLKDYGFTLANQHTFCEVGQGNLNWKKIIPAAERSGCRWFIVEQDTCPGDPFVSLKMSYDYLTTHCCSN